MQKKEVSKALKNLLGISCLGSGFSFAFISYLSAFVLTDVVKLPLLVVSTVLTTQSLITSFVSPFGGVLMDVAKPGKLGRIRKFMLIFPVVWTIGLTLGYAKYSDNMTVTTIILIIVWTMKNISGNMGMNIVPAMAARISSTPNERAFYAGKKALFTSVGMFLYSVSATSIIAFFSKLFNNELAGYRTFAMFTGIVYLITAIIEFFLTKGYDPTQEMLDVAAAEDDIHFAKKGPSLLDIAKNVFTNPQLGIFTITTLFINLSRNLCNTLLIYYYNYVAENTVLYSLNVTLNTVLGMCCSVLVTILCKKLSNKQIEMGAIGLGIIGLLLCKFFGLTQPVVFMIGAVCVNAGFTLNSNLTPALLGDCAVYSEWKTGVNTAASIMGVNSVVTVISNTVKAMIFAAVLGGTGYAAGEIASLTVKAALVNAYVTVPFVFAAIAIVIFIIFYKLDNQKITQYQSEIDKRKAAV